MMLRISRHWRWLVALGAVFVPTAVLGAFQVPHVFKAGTAIKAAEMNENFQALSARLDALTTPPAPVSIGKLSIDGLVTDVPISKFSQSIQVAYSPPGPAGKPQLSDIVVEHDLGDGTPLLSSTLEHAGIAKSAEIVLGNVTITLGPVHLSSVSTGDPKGGVPQEQIGLSFNTIKWTWSDGVNPARLVTWDAVKATGGNGSVASYSFGYFPPGIQPDATYVPISGYTHQLLLPCPTGCKPSNGPVSVKKQFGGDSLDEIGLALAAKPASVNVDVFKDATTKTNQLALTNALVTGVDITTGDDGTLNESATFTYLQIQWKTSGTSAGWDVVNGAGL